ncbi:type I pullulanase [Bacillus suaedae]|uniref:Type I pullulanase n=1 Tax=Halalkalibacter suaedae TaxID=2822140 RepID=A0A941AP60_9BACI|nr:type I pullulanase [Bacillus suaedae]MBP3949813.1 type I pullulanase [Bacillus suaedae]
MKQKQEAFVNWIMTKAELVKINQIHLFFQGTVGKEQGWTLFVGSMTYPLNIEKRDSNMLELSFPFLFPFGEQCYVGCGQQKIPLMITDVVRTIEFDNQFFYNGTDLGLSRFEDKLMLQVWAPTATNVEILLYDNWHTDRFERFSCSRTENGIWKASLDQNRLGGFYLYNVEVNHSWNLAVDPYAKMLSINGERAYLDIIEEQDVDGVSIFDKKPPIIYELHIRDFTIGPNSGTKEKGKYIGLAEEKTRTIQHFETGLDYIKHLGVTHVELLPVQDYGSVDESDWRATYNWGYDTTHFFAVEGSYSTDPYEPFTRVNELKKLIQTFHSNQLKVIVDVVFNHLYIREESALEKLVPGYYFRYESNGDVSDGTGVGNDYASERKMARKLIVDAVEHWLKVFSVDGFRFDLMGILDVDTMHEIKQLATSIQPDVLILGEGWVLPTAHEPTGLASIEQAHLLPDISFFQDQFRDSIKGDTFEESNAGFISGSIVASEAFINGLKGSPSLVKYPSQAINYVESHDNHTLWDKLKLLHPNESRLILEKRHRLATTIVLLSQGTPFLQAGQEWFRTKYGVENSYNSPDWINALNWDERVKNDKYVTYIRDLILFRDDYPVFHLETFKEVEEAFSIHESIQGCFSFTLKDKDQILLVIFNATNKEQKIALPFKGNWQVVVDGTHASLIPLYRLGIDYVLVDPISTFVCVNEQ